MYDGASAAASVIGRAAKRYLARKVGERLVRRPKIKSRHPDPTVSPSNGLVQMGMGGSFSSYERLAPHQTDKFLQKATALNTANWNNGDQSKSTVGTQAAWSTQISQPYFTANDLATIFNDVSGASANGRLYFDSCIGSVMVSNAYLSNCTLDIYDLELKIDVASASYSDPLLAWAAGDVLAGASLEYKKLGASPLESDLFKNIFKIAKKTRVVLGAGQQHKHAIKIQVRKTIPRARPVLMANAGYFAGITYCTMIVHHGSPANDTVTQTQVTVGASGLNIVYEKAYTFREMVKELETVYDHSGLITAFTTAEQVVNEGGSTITTNACLLYTSDAADDYS
jgi:hypothetical protein